MNNTEVIKTEYDANGNVIYEKDSEGIEYWFEYDDLTGNVVYAKDSTGFEMRCSSITGKTIYAKKSNGIECWYGDNGKINHIKNPDGIEYWVDYDENGNTIHRKYPDGYEIWYEYDENDKLLSSHDTRGFIYRYNDRRIIIYAEDSNGNKVWFDDDGNRIQEKY